MLQLGCKGMNIEGMHSTQTDRGRVCLCVRVCVCVCVCMQDVESVLDFVAAGSLGTGRVDVTKIALWGYCYSGELCVFACVCVCVLMIATDRMTPCLQMCTSKSVQTSVPGLNTWVHMVVYCRWPHDVRCRKGAPPGQGGFAQLTTRTGFASV